MVVCFGKKAGLIGVEMLRPGHLDLPVSQVAEKWHIPAIGEAVGSVRTAPACASVSIFCAVDS
jgi:hypothetical protein